MPNPTAPHVVLLSVKAEVRELLPTGEVSGNVAHKHMDGKYEIFRIDAQDRDIAIRKLNELLGELRK